MEIGFVFPNGTKLLCENGIKHEEVARQYLREKGLVWNTDKAEVFMREQLGVIQLGAQNIDRIVRYSEQTELSPTQYNVVMQCRDLGYLVDNGEKSILDARGKTGLVNPVTKKYVYSRSGD